MYSPYFLGNPDNPAPGNQRPIRENRAQIDRDLALYDRLGVKVLLTPMSDASHRNPEGLNAYCDWLVELVKKHPSIQAIEFEKDGSYRQAEKEVVLRSPQNIRVSSGEEENGSVLFQWEYRADYGRVGAAIEIQKPGSREYVPIKKIERVYMNLFTVQLDGSYFDVGENHVRFCHVGGPSITNDRCILVNEDSDYVTYRVIVDENGNMTVKQ